MAPDWKKAESIVEASRCIEIISCSLRLGYLDYAGRVARGLLRYVPRHVEARCLLGQILLEEGRLRRAKSAFQAVMKADPEGVEALVGLGMVAWGQGDTVRARGWLARAREMTPGNDDLEAASLLLGEATSSSGKVGSGPGAQARELADQGEFQRAVEAYERVLSKESRRAELLLGKAEALWRGGDLERAREMLEFLVRDHPGWVKPFLLLADIRLEGGDRQGSEALFRRANELDPGGSVAKRVFQGMSFRRASLPQDIDVRITEAEILAAMPTAVRRMLKLDSREGGEEQGSRIIPEGLLPGERAAGEKSFESHGDEPATRGVQADSIEAIEEELERIARRILPVGEEDLLMGHPVELVVSSRRGLTDCFGLEGFAEINEALEELVDAVEAGSGLDGRLVYVDDVGSLAAFGLSPVDARDPQAVRTLLRAIDESVGNEGGRVRYLLLVGGEEIIPHHPLPNPTDDEEKSVSSDNPYASWGDLLVPDRAVGRLPHGRGDDPALLVSFIRAAAARHRGGESWRRWLWRFLGRIGLSRARSFGYAAQVWESSSREVYSAIGDSDDLWTAPPSTFASLPCGELDKSLFGYFNLHGVKGAAPWYGQRGGGTIAGPLLESPLFPVALTPSQVAGSEVKGMVVFTEACYGAYVQGKGPEDSVALRFLASGAVGLIGATGISYGSLQPPLCGADLLAFNFWRNVKRGATLGEALRGAKESYAREVYRRQGYLDSEDEKTLTAFVLYGDPSLRPAPPIVARRSEEAEDEATEVQRLCHRERETVQVSKALLGHVRGYVRAKLPWMKDATWSVRRQVLCAGRRGGICGTCAGAGHSEAAISPCCLVFISKGLMPLNGQGDMEQIVSVTVDEEGRIVKALVSRGGRLLATRGSRGERRH